MYLPVGDMIKIPAGKTWVGQLAAVRNKLNRIRDVRPGRIVDLPWGGTARVQQLPKTTCADVKAGYSTWIKKLIDANEFWEWSRHTVVKWEYTKPGKALKDLFNKVTVRAACAAAPGMEFPENDLFWVLVLRAALEADSRDVVPSGWELWWESVGQTIEQYAADLPGFPSLIPKIDWTQMMLWSVVGLGGYILLKGKK